MFFYVGLLMTYHNKIVYHFVSVTSFVGVAAYSRFLHTSSSDPVRFQRNQIPPFDVASRNVVSAER